MANEQTPVPHEAGISKDRVWNWNDYHSVFSYRYGSPDMRHIWSEGHKAEVGADVWIAVAATQNKVGLVTDEQVQDLRDHRQDYIAGIDEALSREMDPKNPRYTGHDILAAISVYGDVAPEGGKIVHRPLTSEDYLSNIEVVQMVESVDLVEAGLRNTLINFGKQIEEYKDLPVLGQTHMQAGEPTTLGYRLAAHAQDFLEDYKKLQFVKGRMLGKGIKGPVGTMAEVETLLDGKDMDPLQHEVDVMDQLGLEAFPISNQTYPRKLTADVIGVLADIGVSAQRFGLNMRIYQSSLFDELAEPRNSRDRGSSAMPHKRNPRHAENIIALARGIKFKHLEAQEVAANVVMERGIDDSAGKRSFLPEAFLAADEVLKRVGDIAGRLVVNKDSIWRNLHTFSQFTATAPIMAEMTKGGADRQESHEVLAQIAQRAFDSFRATGANTFGEEVLENPEVRKYMTEEQIKMMIDQADHHVGMSAKLCDIFLQEHLYPALFPESNGVKEDSKE
ncbi:MAG TPA: lyase family protein [Patescibacteria group bacterium]|nr:lyase family protein [Patescibacteria group bacterium]